VSGRDVGQSYLKRSSADGGAKHPLLFLRSSQHSKKEFMAQFAIALQQSKLAREREQRLAELEEAQFQNACKETKEGNVLEQAQKARWRQLVTERARAQGVVPVHTAEDGNCQFRAVLQSAQGAGLLTDMNHLELREAVCDYIDGAGDFFGNFLDEHDPADVMAYATNMRRVNIAWGDELTLRAIAHIVGRPIRVITSTSDSQYIRVMPRGQSEINSKSSFILPEMIFMSNFQVSDVPYI